MTAATREVFSTKQAARTFARELRHTWTPEREAAWEVAIRTRLLATPFWQSASTVLTYVGARTGELNTLLIIHAALEQGKRVLVPITLPEGQMTWSSLTSTDSLVRTPLGLLEPENGAQPVAEDTRGLCIVPGMLFRRDGHRLGFGGGYYDRFLQDHKGITVGLCPACCVGHTFPTMAHDIPVAYIVTESECHAAAAS